MVILLPKMFKVLGIVKVILKTLLLSFECPLPENFSKKVLMNRFYDTLVFMRRKNALLLHFEQDMNFTLKSKQ